MRTANEVRQLIANQQDTSVKFNFILEAHERELTDRIEKMIVNKTDCFVYHMQECWVNEVMKMLTAKGFHVRITNIYKGSGDYDYPSYVSLAVSL